jgi:GTP-binding protein
MKVTMPVVALVGRPNVGKSTLFNRLAGMRKAIVEDIPGITRDRIYEHTDWEGRDFIIIDTGGIRFEEGDMLAAEIRKQSEVAIEEADVIVLVVDTREGITTEDEMVAGMLRRAQKPIVVAANKVEDFSRQVDYYEFYRLGLGEPIPLSAEHGMNVNDLLDVIVSLLPPVESKVEEDLTIHISFVGRPNVGKSSLVNRLLGEERVIVSEIPGTTRDAIDTPFRFKDRRYVLIDTAGMRRKGRIKEATERYSVIRALRAVERSDVVLTVLDAAEGVTEQDKRIAGFVHEEGKSNIIVVNKWDLVKKTHRTMQEFDNMIREELKFLAYSPIVYVSALTGKRVFEMLEVVDFVAEQYAQKVPTSELNRVLREALLLNPPPGGGRKKVKIFYITQVKTAPPTFVVFVNYPEQLHFTYLRYLENHLRQNFGFEGTPIRFIVRQRSSRRR